MKKNSITQITKKAIFDELRINNIFYLPSDFNEVEFWNRLYNLDDLPSLDSRFKDMSGDMWQHRINNPTDWDDYWFLGDSRINLMASSDEDFLRFLSETLHPLVRSDKAEAEKLLNIYNKNLKEDGYEIIVVKTISGRGIYGGAELKTGKHTDRVIVEVAEKLGILDSEYITQQIDSLRIQRDTNPEYVIGQCKELIESFCKSILEEQGFENVDKLDFPDLVKEVNNVINLLPAKVSNEKRGAEIIKGVLGAVTNVAYKINELRGLYGTGHGKSSSYIGLTPRHASLVLNLTSGLLIFWVETYELQK